MPADPRSTSPLATVVVVNWNGAHLLPDCLDGLAAQDLPEGQAAVWVVDNASADGTADRLRDQGEVYGKTGTAEFTDESGRAHGWFVGYRGDVAFAVLVVDGGSSEAAVAVAQRFLAAVPS